MLKNKFKMIVILFTVITLISSFCVIVNATDDTPVVTSENVDNTDDVPTITNEENNTEEAINEDTPNNEEESNVIYDDLYLFEDSVVMDKIVDGNVYIFGNNVKITGKVNGSLFVFGNEVTFTSPYPEDDTEHQNDNYCYVAGSVFACANKITFNAVTQDIYAFSNTFDMSYESYIMRDVRIAASDITLKGYITRDAYLYADTFNFGTASADEEENDSALISGDLYYYSSNEAEIPDTTVQGETKFTAFDTSDDDTNTKSVVDYLMDLLSVIIYTLVIYLLFTWLAPKFFENSGIILKDSALLTFGIGILVFLVVPIVAFILLCLTFFSLSMTLATIYGLLLAISFTVVTGSLTYLLKDKLGFADKKLLLVLIAIIVLWALKQIPFVGPIITIIISIFGLGIITKNLITKK